MNESRAFEAPPQAAPVLIQLLKGALFRDQQEALWQALMDFQALVRDYFGILGLELFLDEAEGYAFLRQVEADAADESALPRLVQRRALSYPVSLLCVLLRKRLVEQDAGGGDLRLVLSREQMVEMMRVFLPDAGNQAKTVDQIHRHINKVVELGFLRPLRGEEQRYEVRRILKALVDADWLGDLDARLESYRRYVLEQAES